MSTAAEWMGKAQAAGLTLAAHHGKLVVSGRSPPAALLASLREHRAALLVLLDAPTGEEASEVFRRQRWGCVPEEPLPLVPSLDVLPADAEAVLLAYLGRMPPEVGIWLAQRAVAYRAFNGGWTDRQAMVTAAVDLVLWH